MKKIAWIVNPYGALPSEGWLEYRSYKLAKKLKNKGYKVVVWTSKFEHRKKVFRSNENFKKDSDLLGIQIIGLDGPGYQNNISLKRIYHETVFGRNFMKASKKLTAPNTIIVGDPSIFFSKPVIAYSLKNDVKIIVDVIDLWPELFKVALPKFLRDFHRVIFYFLYRRRDYLLAKSSGLVGCTNDYVERINPPKGLPTSVSYFGIDSKIFKEPFKSRESKIVEEFFQNADLRVIFAGTYGRAYDMDTIFETIELLNTKKRKIKFLFVGDGDHKDNVKNIALKYPKNVLELDSMPLNKLVEIYKYFDVGLCTYNIGSTVSMPTKFYDCLGSELVSITSLDGEISEFIKKYDIGMIYEAENPKSLLKVLEKLSYQKDILNQKKENIKQITEIMSSDHQYEKFAKFVDNVVF
ncbi:glycosyltransferase family 4 protein [Pseudomonadota bacterium]|nr:glycosyltransferase family 4 protein [Pseudomonadota bacterium]